MISNLPVQTCAFYVHGDGLLHALTAETYTEASEQSSTADQDMHCIFATTCLPNKTCDAKAKHTTTHVSSNKGKRNKTCSMTRNAFFLASRVLWNPEPMLLQILIQSRLFHLTAALNFFKTRIDRKNRSIRSEKTRGLFSPTTQLQTSPYDRTQA